MIKHLLILALTVSAFISCGKKTDQSTTQTSENKTTTQQTSQQQMNKQAENVKDYLNTGNTLTLDNVTYDLAWSSNPSPGYYKQEYIPAGDSLNRFKTMLMIEAVMGNSKPKEAAAGKVAELNRLKSTDPMVNHNIFEKDGEVMLDFIMSGKSDKEEIIERNIYRYKTIKDSDGKDGLLLFGISERAYDDGIDKFLAELKQNKMDLLNSAGSFKLPEVKFP